jgi:uncharacterized protein
MNQKGTLRIVVVADTHSSPHASLARHIDELRPDAILHAGDVGDPAVLDGLAKLGPLFAVRGNIDVRASDLPDVFTVGLVGGHDIALRILVVHIALQGVRLRTDILRLARAEGASLVVCGHSHIPFIGRDGGLDVFNPGSSGPRRFGLPIVFGVLEWTGAEMHYAHRDCETGAIWTPQTARPASQRPA